MATIPPPVVWDDEEQPQSVVPAPAEVLHNSPCPLSEPTTIVEAAGRAMDGGIHLQNAFQSQWGWPWDGIILPLPFIPRTNSSTNQWAGVNPFEWMSVNCFYIPFDWEWSRSVERFYHTIPITESVGRFTILVALCFVGVLQLRRIQQLRRRKRTPFPPRDSMSMISLHHRPRTRTDSLQSVSSVTRYFRNNPIANTTSAANQSSGHALQDAPYNHNHTGGSNNASHTAIHSGAIIWGQHYLAPIPQQRYAGFEDELHSGYAPLRFISALSARTERRFAYQGCGIETITYSTLTPPPSWAEASRYLLPRDMGWQLQRVVILDVARQPPQISIRHENRPLGSTTVEFQESVMEVGLHVRVPPNGAVLHLYKKGASSPEEWMEHTFQSTADAAQFQMDLLATQYLGKPIQHMYQALEIVHRGSLAYTGSEPVVHDRTIDVDQLPTEPTGVAWDDVMRCLGVHFPSLQMRLEALWQMQMNGITRSTMNEPQQRRGKKKDPGPDRDLAASVPSSPLMADEYVNKRLQLGIVDFFRLFVPLMADFAVPQNFNSVERMKQVLFWRKHIARAAVLVRAYVRARTVVNQGWSLGRSVPVDVEYLRMRLAYDDNWENLHRDSTAKLEYYEATVSRDVICEVRGEAHPKPRLFGRLRGGSTELPILSGYQGYALVGMHTIQWVVDDPTYPLQPHIDPVSAIPSLKDLCLRNRDLHFFIHSFFSEGSESAVTIAVFVRSLPIGIDPCFDKVIDRFAASDSGVRKEKLECIFQLGVDVEGMSIFARFLLTLLSLLLSWSLSNRQNRTSQPVTTRSRTAIPAIILSECGESFHFGGSLHVDPGSPNNYIASSTFVSLRSNNVLPIRLLIGYMESGGLAKDVLDFTYVIAGVERDEVPERAIGTVRISSAIKHCALPVSYLYEEEDVQNAYNEAITTSPPSKTNVDRRGLSDIGLVFDILVLNPLRSLLAKPYFSPEKAKGSHPIDLRPTPISTTRVPQIVSTADVLEEAVNELIRCLGEVTIPVRKESASWSLSDNMRAANDNFIQMPILDKLTRSDIRRFFLASDWNLKIAATRIVQSAAWRGLTFPIDTRSCRVELQSGQFFQQGRDLDGCPIFYFRNFCLGPWRNDESATIASILQRLETTLDMITLTEPAVKCTIIAIMGRPLKAKKSTSKIESETGETAQGNDTSDRESTSYRRDENNPRIPKYEKWHPHSNRRLILRLIDILMCHYPERLSKALVVLRHDDKEYMRTKLRGKLVLQVAVPSARTREKVKFLTRHKDLLEFVDRDTLVKLVGGNAQISQTVFESP